MDLNETVKVTVEKDGKTVSAESVPANVFKIVLIFNTQFTNAPNTTQIASGAGHDSAAANNAALDSSNTLQQQSVGADGEAVNRGQSGEQTEPHIAHETHCDDKELVMVFNHQRNRGGQPRSTEPTPVVAASATQVASGGGNDSVAGTNATIESSNTKQQHAVGGGEGAEAVNRGQDADQDEL